MTKEAVQNYLAMLDMDQIVLLGVLRGHCTFRQGPRHLFFVEFFVNGKRYECLCNDVGQPLQCETYHQLAEVLSEKLLGEWE